MYHLTHSTCYIISRLSYFINKVVCFVLELDIGPQILLLTANIFYVFMIYFIAVAMITIESVSLQKQLKTIPYPRRVQMADI